MLCAAFTRPRFRRVAWPLCVTWAPSTGRYWSSAGPTGNLQATRALLAEAEALGIPPEHMLCSGDLVAYCADPQATADLIRAASIPVVMGNCEESLGEDAEDCGCGFTPGSSCDMLSVQRYRYAVQALRGNAERLGLGQQGQPVPWQDRWSGCRRRPWRPRSPRRSRRAPVPRRALVFLRDGSPALLQASPLST